MNMDSDFINSVKDTLKDEAENILATLNVLDDPAALLSGKLLRTRLAGRFCDAGICGVSNKIMMTAAVAVEMAHTATLCHDDVIDNGLVRRGVPTLWRESTPSCAILVGDMILSRTIELMADDAPDYVGKFARVIREVCCSEAKQELVYRGEVISPEDNIKLARGKTGPLFAFLGFVAGGEDAALAETLEEVGYRLGTAYQVFDDLLDMEGSEVDAKKTLHTDALRKKFTIAASSKEATRAELLELCRGALELLEDRPEVKTAVMNYIEKDLEPIFSKVLNIVLELKV